jgi:hypothetical protein
MRTVFALILAAAAAVLGVLPASAAIRPVKPVFPNVFIDDEHGVLTTPCVVYPGEVLHGVGYVTGTFRITSVKPHGPVFKVTLSPFPVAPQSSEVLDFTTSRPGL